MSKRERRGRGSNEVIKQTLGKMSRLLRFAEVMKRQGRESQYQGMQNSARLLLNKARQIYATLSLQEKQSLNAGVLSSLESGLPLPPDCRSRSAVPIPASQQASSRPSDSSFMERNLEIKEQKLEECQEQLRDSVARVGVLNQQHQSLTSAYLDLKENLQQLQQQYARVLAENKFYSEENAQYDNRLTKLQRDFVQKRSELDVQRNLLHGKLQNCTVELENEKQRWMELQSNARRLQRECEQKYEAVSANSMLLINRALDELLPEHIDRQQYLGRLINEISGGGQDEDEED